MDKFTRNYSIGLAVIAVLILIGFLYEPPLVSKLNNTLIENHTINNYPYRFRVLDLDDGVATMTSPRSAEFSVYQALGLLYPSLKEEPPESDAMLQAQAKMVEVQSLAQSIVMQSEVVDRVVWQLDHNWLKRAGVDVNLL